MDVFSTYENPHIVKQQIVDLHVGFVSGSGVRQVPLILTAFILNIDLSNFQAYLVAYSPCSLPAVINKLHKKSYNGI